jgi:hypothetical protein
MNEILGYGEDAFTLWVFRKRISEILNRLNDQSDPSNCLIFFRPSFGRRAGKGSAQFGEFDSILASSENIYLIESKWDNFLENEDDKIRLDKEQRLRHKIFSWYYMNWVARQNPDWGKFRNTFRDNFIRNFPDRKIAPVGSLLAQNLEFILNKLQEHCKKFSCEYKKPRNVLFYFYDRNRSKEIRRIIDGDVDFEVVNIDYSQHILGKFITLD